MIFDFADKVRFLNSFVWHYIVEGADDKQTQKFKDQLTKQPPKQGGVQVTNEKVKIEAQTPDFKGQDMAEGAKMVKLYGLGGAGLPAWFFADADNSNRATAEEMSGPTGKKILNRQNHLGECLSRVLDFVIEKAIEAGVLRDGVDTSYTLDFPELAVKDLTKGAQTLQGAAASLMVGVEQGWIGADIDDSQAEFDAAQKEKTARARTEQNDLFDQKQLAAALAQGAQSGLPIKPGAGDPSDKPPVQAEA